MDKTKRYHSELGAKGTMLDWRSWFYKEWNDIKGNVKYGLLMTSLAGMLAGTNWPLDGVSAAKRLLVMFAFGIVILWAAVATWGHRWKGRASQPEKEMLGSLQIEVLRVARDLGDFVREICPKPQAKKGEPNKTSEDIADVLVRQTELERPW